MKFTPHSTNSSWDWFQLLPLFGCSQKCNILAPQDFGVEIPNPLGWSLQILWDGSLKSSGMGSPNPLEQNPKSSRMELPNPLGWSPQILRDDTPKSLGMEPQILWDGSPKPSGIKLPNPLGWSPRCLRSIPRSPGTFPGVSQNQGNPGEIPKIPQISPNPTGSGRTHLCQVPGTAGLELGGSVGVKAQGPQIWGPPDP